MMDTTASEHSEPDFTIDYRTELISLLHRIYVRFPKDIADVGDIMQEYNSATMGAFPLTKSLYSAIPDLGLRTRKGFMRTNALLEEILLYADESSVDALTEYAVVLTNFYSNAINNYNRLLRLYRELDYLSSKQTAKLNILEGQANACFQEQRVFDGALQRVLLR